MRVKFFSLILLLCMFMLTGCSRVIDSPSDELRLFSWRGEYENNNVVTLEFNGSDATLSVENDDINLNLDGLCVMSDDQFTICDVNSDVNYTFDYILYGDRVELTFIDGTIVLKKQ